LVPQFLDEVFDEVAGSVRFGFMHVNSWSLTWTQPRPTRSLSLPQRIERITAVADIFNSAMYSADASMEARASEDLSGTRG
jgi:hypothetical protein